MAHLPGCEIADEFPRLLDEAKRIFTSLGRKHHNWWITRHTIEKRMRKVHLALGTSGGNPPDRTWRNDCLERVVGQAVIPFGGLVKQVQSPSGGKKSRHNINAWRF
jgi:hypothetical protein